MSTHNALHDDRWFDDDGFWSAVAPVLFGPTRTEAARSEVAQIVEALDLQPPATVLDLFCGPGRHLVPLNQLGFDVIGVDCTRHFVRAAQEALSEGLELSEGLVGAREAPRATVLECQIGGPGRGLGLQARNTTGVETVDVALWLGASAGYDGLHGDARTLAWIRRHLVSGGLLLIEGPVAEDLTAAPFAPWEWFDERHPTRGETVAVWRLEHGRTSDGWLSGRWTRYCEGRHRRYRFSYQVHSLDTWSEVLSQEGFTLVQRTTILDRLNPSATGTSPSEPSEPVEPLARSWLLARAN